MSKLPNHTILTRATTSSGRSTAVLASKSHNSTIADHKRRGHYAQRSESARQNEITGSTNGDASELALMGAVSAPYHGPQPAAVVKVYERQQQQQYQQIEEISSLSNLSNYMSLPAFNFPLSLNSLFSSSQNVINHSVMRNGVPLSLSFSHPTTRNLHVWPQVQAQAQTQSNTYNPNDENAFISTKVASSSKRRSKKQNKLLFDVSESTRDSNSLVKGKGKSIEQISASVEDDRSIDSFYELMTKLMKSQQRHLLKSQSEAQEHNQHTGKRRSKQFDGISEERAETRPYHDSSTFFDTNKVLPETSPSHSPSPSPGPSSERSRDQVGFRSNIPDVNGPRAKFAVTTSAESSISSNTAGDGGSSKAAELQYLASTSSATPPQGSSSSLPPQASSSSGSTDHWAKTFRLPRSTKDHEFMFEHGAYGIPKRHPLSSIRKASSSGFNGKGERTTPSRDVVPTSKVRAATDMLAAAAEFLAGSQSVPATAANTSEFRPSRGNDALQAALAGGSTAEGYEVQQHFIEASKTDTDSKTDVHRMTIRGPDGRVIKERLRSVQVGEDAYFLRPDALGVADGVGGWASRPGADPALFSRLLMHFCAVELSRYDGLSASELAADNGSLLKAWASVDAVEVMHRAWERCVRASRREGILGSSTALIGILRGEELRIANMGDCVLMIIRGGEMMFRSTEQQHSFNFPVQLGMMGDTTDTIKKHVMASQNRDRAAAEGEVASGAMEDYDAVEEDRGAAKAQQSPGSRSRNDTAPPVTPDRQSADDVEPDWDEPRRDAGRWTVRVKAGDIIVVGSDGLMDNLFDEDIIEEVIRFLPPLQTNAEGEQEEVKIDASNFSPQMVSEALCSRAKAVSEDSRAISSPFQQRAMEEGLNYVGGKHDDISVLVCLVGERDGLVFETEGEQKDEPAQEEVKAERAQL
jgi:serine/threonine protein phosphatase PrpC